MAKLGIYYGLCPIIDERSLLGINKDFQQDQVIVTLGKNIAIKYKISDQKQLFSWTTKEKFTSPVIYLEQFKKYCSVFNHTHLRLWHEKDDHIDKGKKLKFNKLIYTIVNCASHSFVVFQNGSIVLLDEAIEKCKDLEPANILSDEEIIIDFAMIPLEDKVISGLFIKNKITKSVGFLYNMDTTSGKNNFARIRLDKTKVTLSGYALITSHTGEAVLLTIWSDGRMFSYSLDGSNEEKFCTVVDSVSCKDKITMTPLNEDYVALYAADISQEGAVLIIYNIQFNVTQCKQPFKMYTSGAKLWNIDSNLFLCVGQNIAVIPYHLHNEQLAALVGSHKVRIIDSDIEYLQELVKTDWEPKEKSKKEKIPPNDRVQELSEQGWSESMILEEVLPTYLSKNDLANIDRCLAYFKDFSEEYQVKLLDYILSLDSVHFKRTEKVCSVPDFVAPAERCRILDKLLMVQFSSATIIPQIRNHLAFTNALKLLQYICHLLSENGHNMMSDVTKCEKKLIEWGTILLDANYQKFMLTKKDHIIELLKSFNNVVEAYQLSLNELQKLAPVISSIQNSQCLKSKNATNLRYCIEELKLC